MHGVDNPRGTYRPAQLTVPSTHGPSASKGKSGLAAFRRQCRLATVRFDPQVKGIQVNDIEELQKKVSDLEAMVLAAFAAGITTRVNAAGTIKLTIDKLPPDVPQEVKERAKEFVDKLMPLTNDRLA